MVERLGPIGIVDLADCVGRDYTTVSRQVSEFEEFGLADRGESPVDRRVREAIITKRSKAMTDKVDAAREKMARDVFSDWKGGEVGDLVRLMRRFGEAALHMLHEDAFDLRLSVFPGNAVADLPDRRRQFLGVLKSEHDAAGVGLCGTSADRTFATAGKRKTTGSSSVRITVAAAQGIPTARVDHLSHSQIWAYAIADDRLYKDNSSTQPRRQPDRQRLRADRRMAAGVYRA